MTIWKPVLAPGPNPPWKVILLDRDGVVIRDRGYLSDPAGVELVPGAGDALAGARKAGWFLAGISNQSGLGRGLFDPRDLASVMRRLDEELEACRAPLDAFAYCPHAPGEGCSCRKPEPGLLAELGILAGLDHRSWVVGDKLSDVELGLGLGMRAVLVMTGYGPESLQQARARNTGVLPFHSAADLPAAIDLILADEGSDA